MDELGYCCLTPSEYFCGIIMAIIKLYFAEHVDDVRVVFRPTQLFAF